MGRKRALLGDVNKHDHEEGTSRCAACIAEHTEERKGGILWRDWCAELVERLTGKHPGPDVDREFTKTRISRSDAVEMWGRNFTPAAYMRLRKLRVVPKEVVMKKNKKPKYHVRDGFSVVEGLYAFWSYDLFPFVCGGTVMAMDQLGRAQIEEYQGGIVRPIKILPIDAGRALHASLRQLDRDYDLAHSEFKTHWKSKVLALLPEAGKE